MDNTIKNKNLLNTSSNSIKKTANATLSDSSSTLEEGGDFKQENGYKFAGKHYIVDFWGVDKLNDLTFIEDSLKAAAEAAAAILLHIHLHKFSGGGGVTGVALLAESHISIHTWPEYNYAAFDVFMCGDAEPEKAVALLESVFTPSRVETQEILRGKLRDNDNTKPC